MAVSLTVYDIFSGKA